MKPIGIITSGGDAPGMNAAIHGVCMQAAKYSIPCIGFMDGYEGLIDNQYISLTPSLTKQHVNQGGTFLGTARSERFKEEQVQEQVARRIKEQIQALIVIGGDGSFKGMEALMNRGIPAIGIPATIDNDIEGTAITLGYQTAVRNVVEAIDILIQSADSHRHIYAVEVMGRGEGYIARFAGQAVMADGIIATKTDFNLDTVLQQIDAAVAQGHRSQLFVIAEGAMTAHEFKELVESHSSYRIHDFVLGHLQRGGNPVAQDRISGINAGKEAIEVCIHSAFSDKKFVTIPPLSFK